MNHDRKVYCTTLYAKLTKLPKDEEKRIRLS